MIPEILLIVAGGYLSIGLLFALPFVMVGAARIDPQAAQATWGFRVIILPGTILLWPLLTRRWLSGTHEPPEEINAHRRAARKEARL